MQFESFYRWIQKIYATQDEELDCDEFLDAIPRYVDMEVAGDATNPYLPQVEIHLGHCSQCQDLYLTLRDAAQLEEQSTPQIPLELATDPIPQPDTRTIGADSPLPGETAF